MAERSRAKAEVVLQLFGVNLEHQGRGFYVSLEMLAIARGAYVIDEDLLLANDSSTIRYKRISHDLARRIATRATIVEGRDELAKAVELETPEAFDTLRALFSSLVVEVPGRKKAPSWFGAHLYPFVGELIHYDATERVVPKSHARSKDGSKRSRQAKTVDSGAKAPQIERYLFRDGGGWAYKVLRTDSNDDRRIGTRQGLAELVRDSGTPLGNLAKSLSAHDFDYDEEPYEDIFEGKIEIFDESDPSCSNGSTWPELMRDGVHNIVTRSAAPRAKRIESLMHWVPYCLARHQLCLARRKLNVDTEAVLLDFGNETSPLRTASRKHLDEFRADIVGALNVQAKEMVSAAGSDTEIQRYEKFARETGAAVTSPRAFFTETLAAVGALNSTTGRRHFTLKPPMLEAIVSATIAGDREMEFGEFCKAIYQKYGLVVHSGTMGRDALAYDVPPSVLDRNLNHFRDRLAAVGLLTQYSDATSMVRGEPR
ncbi:hypothetical protein FFT09_12155 [Saccharomonospora piscinae]|uniref:hypothetical protein n=1 Tax=Saccharomonospora piscinae TaxID=687388 RepID=UPI001106E4C8|nr:hypothetical protein [Saccharomonospora piscinae]TLW91686.1 hypothetical protein FFT09_12155 [Saccharomonospora piscinae]